MSSSHRSQNMLASESASHCAVANPVLTWMEQVSVEQYRELTLSVTAAVCSESSVFGGFLFVC